MSTIKAPIPGLFYRRSSPDADPFVDEGGIVTAGQTIALIEVMKSFTEVKADASGTVVKFLIDEGEEVSMGDNIVEVDGA